MTRSTTNALIALGLATVVGSTTVGAQVIPLGDTFDAAALPGRHESPVVAPGPDGSFRLLWAQPSKGIHEAIWDAGGTRRVPLQFALSGKVTGDVLLLADDTFSQPHGYGSGILHRRTQPDLTDAAADGTFWAVWTEGIRWVTSGPLHWDASTVDEDVYTRRFTLDGRPLGLPVRVDQGGAEHQRAAQVVARPGGGILAVWEHGDANTHLEAGDEVRIRALNANGAGISNERSIDGGATMGRAPSIALGADGITALVAWEAKIEAGENTGVWARPVDARNGALLGEPVRLDDGFEKDQRRTSIAALPDGTFLVVWQGATNDHVTGYTRIYQTQTRGRRVDADGVPIGPVMVISDSSEEQNTAPQAVSLGDGRVFVTWMTWGTSVFRPLYVAGAIVDDLGPGEQLELTTGLLATQVGPVVAANGTTIFLSWSGYDENDEPTVFGRRFQVAGQ